MMGGRKAAAMELMSAVLSGRVGYLWLLESRPVFPHEIGPYAG